jgi:heme oxygenase
MFLRQVEMRSGNMVRVGWIEEDLAKVGKRVRDEDDEVGPVWKITQVYSRIAAKALDYMEKAQRDFASKLK